LTHAALLRLLWHFDLLNQMKRLFPSAILILVALALPALPAAETKSAPPAARKSAPAPAIAGEYTGHWKGQNEATGALRINLQQDAAGAWVAKAWFTFEGAEVATTMKSVKVEGPKVEMAFAWVVQGTAAQSQLTGKWSGSSLEGTYENTSQEGPASGTWKVTRG
jgi:hypothetical protein